MLVGLLLLFCVERTAWATPGSFSTSEKRQFVKAFLQAEKDDPEAQYVVGMMYYRGQQIPQDKTLASQWFTKAADQGHSGAQYFLSLMVGLGDGISQNDKKAADWCRKAALQSHADAQYSLGRMYSTGQGVLRDDIQAVAWLTKAALQSHPDAQCDLGLMYKSGRGVKQDINQATEWWVKASQQGHTWSGLLLQEAMQSGLVSSVQSTSEKTRKEADQLVSTIGGDLGIDDEPENDSTNIPRPLFEH